MFRTLIPHSRTESNEPLIDSFSCSRCGWSHPISQPVPYQLPYNDVEIICRAFERHRCEEFAKPDNADVA